MNNKRAVKRLMGMGIQRNDAAAFVSTYRAIVAAGKEKLLPDILRPIPAPVPPLRRTDYRIKTFATMIRCSDKYDFMRVPTGYDDEYIRKTLAKELGLAMLDAGAIRVTIQTHPPRLWCDTPTVEYRATIDVAMEATL